MSSPGDSDAKCMDITLGERALGLTPSRGPEDILTPCFPLVWGVCDDICPTDQSLSPTP